MAAGKIFVNEGPNGEVIMDLSRSPGEILYSSEPYGFALARTFACLGIVATGDIDRSQLTLEGSVEDARHHMLELQRHAGSISTRASEISFGPYPDHVKSYLDNTFGYILRILGNMPGDTPFANLCGSIVYRFADVHVPDNESLVMKYGVKAPWRMTAAERQALGIPTGIYGERTELSAGALVGTASGRD